ncbi:hypothetical protein BDV19DRAFT_164703 [Aspergillus venezuelensis]
MLAPPIQLGEGRDSLMSWSASSDCLQRLCRADAVSSTRLVKLRADILWQLQPHSDTTPLEYVKQTQAWQLAGAKVVERRLCSCTVKCPHCVAPPACAQRNRALSVTSVSTAPNDDFQLICLRIVASVFEARSQSMIDGQHGVTRNLALAYKQRMDREQARLMSQSGDSGAMKIEFGESTDKKLRKTEAEGIGSQEPLQVAVKAENMQALLGNS